MQTIQANEEIIHLTLTGFNAGQTLCGSSRNERDKYLHANYAPLHREEVRNKTCGKCLKEYALAMVELDEEEPDREFKTDRPTWVDEIAMA